MTPAGAPGTASAHYRAQPQDREALARRLAWFTDDELAAEMDRREMDRHRATAFCACHRASPCPARATTTERTGR